MQGNPQQGPPKAAWANRERVHLQLKRFRGWGGGNHFKNVFFSTMQKLRHISSNSSKIIACAAAAAALLWCANPAKAILNINIYDDGPNLTVVVSGSLSALGSNAVSDGCIPGGLLFSPYVLVICAGATHNSYPVTGPDGFGGTAENLPAGSTSGATFILQLAGVPGEVSGYAIDPNYVPAQPFFSSATFNNTSALAQGFTVPGLVGTWTINDTSESINVFVGPPSSPSAAVPGPLLLLGAGAAFGWSRRIRRRITAPVSTPPQA